MLAFLTQVNLWLPRDMEGVGGLVVGRYPGVKFQGAHVCAAPQGLPPSWVEGAGSPAGTGQDDTHVLTPGRC